LLINCFISAFEAARPVFLFAIYTTPEKLAYGKQLIKLTALQHHIAKRVE
jgi:hypothetical protein